VIEGDELQAGGDASRPVRADRHETLAHHNLRTSPSCQLSYRDPAMNCGQRVGEVRLRRLHRALRLAALARGQGRVADTTGGDQPGITRRTLMNIHEIAGLGWYTSGNYRLCVVARGGQ